MRTVEIEERDSALGSGWRLRLIEDGEEVGGGVFPVGVYLDDADGDRARAVFLAYTDASGVAADWLLSLDWRPNGHDEPGAGRPENDR